MSPGKSGTGAIIQDLKGKNLARAIIYRLQYVLYCRGKGSRTAFDAA